MVKTYRLINHNKRPTNYIIGVARSKQDFAKMVGRPLSHINNYLSILTGEQAAPYAHLTEGQQIEEAIDKEVQASGINMIDINRISALGRISAARQSLAECDLRSNQLKDRLSAILYELKELEADFKEQIDKDYRGR